tara:strand:+ start:420 stop:800 length:381 start_codon:yes stop_codon:yes gene_type:complete
LYLTNVGPIIEFIKVPGNEPTEKQAKNIPATLLSKIKNIISLHRKLLIIIENEEAKAMVEILSKITFLKFIKTSLNSLKLKSLINSKEIYPAKPIRIIGSKLISFKIKVKIIARTTIILMKRYKFI